MEIQSGWYEIQQPKQLERKSLMKRHLVRLILKFFRLDYKEKETFEYFGISKENIGINSGEVVLRFRTEKALEILRLISCTSRIATMAGYDKPNQIVGFFENMTLVSSSEETFCSIKQWGEISNITDVEPHIPKILSLTPEEVQKRRDEVRDMAYKGKPKDGIKLYPGRKIEPDAVAFFKKEYSGYIVPNQEVIFQPELHAIDAALLAALRNDCRSPSNPMPLGRVQERTDARLEGRFSDGKAAEQAIRRAQFRSKSRFANTY